MRQLVGQDATFLHVETATVKTHFTILTIYDQSMVPGGMLRYRDILKYFDQRLTPLDVFRRKLVPVPFNLDAPYWVDDPSYHIESHVRHIALPKPGDWRQFCILLARLHARGLDMRRPLWEAYVIEGLAYFGARAPQRSEVWRTDGTANGTVIATVAKALSAWPSLAT